MAAAADGTIYVGCNGTFYAVNSAGQKVWDVPDTGHITAAAAIAQNGNIYFGDWDGLLVAVDPNGVVLWNYPTTGYVSGSSPLIGPDGTVYVGTLSGVVHAVTPPKPSPIASSGWPMFMHDPQHSAREGGP